MRHPREPQPVLVANHRRWERVLVAWNNDTLQLFEIYRCISEYSAEHSLVVNGVDSRSDQTSLPRLVEMANAMSHVTLNWEPTR